MDGGGSCMNDVPLSAPAPPMGRHMTDFLIVCVLYCCCCQVSPWDVDTDYEERLRQEEEAKKAAAAAAAAEELARQEAAAEAARQKRRQNQRARLGKLVASFSTRMLATCAQDVCLSSLLLSSTGQAGLGHSSMLPGRSLLQLLLSARRHSCASALRTSPPCVCLPPDLVLCVCHADQIGDLGVGAAERDDDDDYNPEDDSSDSEGGRKNRKSKLAKLQHQQSLSLMPQQAQHAFGESRGGRRGRGAGGRGRGTGLTWSGGGRGGRAGGAMGPAGGIMPLHAGHAWTRVQIEQQQSMHLNSLQQSMATAMATGNTALLAQLASGAAGNQVLPPPLPLVGCMECDCDRVDARCTYRARMMHTLFCVLFSDDVETTICKYGCIYAGCGWGVVQTYDINV